MSCKENPNEGFNNTTDSIILDCKKTHLDMQEVENMIKEITNVYEKE